MDPRYMQSRMSIKRGLMFEKGLRRDDYVGLLAALRDAGLRVPDGISVAEQDQSMSFAARWDDTRRVLEKSDHVLLSAQLMNPFTGGYLEADAIILLENVVHIVEVKSWPMVDGRPADPSACGKALDQMAVYAVILKEQGVTNVSTDGFLVNPKNVGMEPIVTKYDLRARVLKQNRVLRRVRDAASEPVRIDLDEVTKNIGSDRVVGPLTKFLHHNGTNFDPSVCSSCALVRVCHEDAYNRAEVTIMGTGVRRSAAPFTNLVRLSEILRGETPTEEERTKAELLKAVDGLREEIGL